MSDKLNFIFVFSGFWFMFGLIFLTLGIFLSDANDKKKKKCTAKTNGIVSDIYVSTEGVRSTGLFPIFKYTVNSLTYVERYTHSSFPSRFAVGQEVEICYNPENPHEFYIPGDKSPKFIKRVLYFFGIMFITLAIILAITFYKN